VQAYRYENFELSGLKTFFFSRVFNNLEIANSFHWLVHLEQHKPVEANADVDCNEEEAEIKEKYQDLYDEFLEICERDWPEYYQSLEL
jgi:hypothetical protein